MLSNDYLILPVIISYIIYCYTVFGVYARNKALTWPIISGVVTGIFTVLYAVKLSNSKSHRLMIGVLVVAIITSMIFLGINGKHLSDMPKEQEVQKEKEINEVGMNYLIAFGVFSSISLLCKSDIINISSYYEPGSTVFLSIFTLICFTIFTSMDAIRRSNILGLFKGPQNNNYLFKKIEILILGIWQYFCLLVFSGLILPTGLNEPNQLIRHLFTIAILSLVFISTNFVGFMMTINKCNSWKSGNIMNNVKELQINMISFAIMLIILIPVHWITY